MLKNSAVLNDIDGELAHFFAAVAEDLEALALLHHTEPTNGLIEDLKAVGFPGNLALKLSAQESTEILTAALAEMQTPLDAVTLDRLAVDYAAIYLTYSLGASPYESVWLDEEHLACQNSMFAVREWYKRFELSVENWRTRADDHLVLQLLFVAHLLKKNAGQDAAAFMDAHLLRWLTNFAQRIATRCDTQYFAGVSILTAVYCEKLRDLLAELLDAPRKPFEEPEKPKISEPVLDCGSPYVPGQGPGW